jgi:hypothetical protein
VSILDSTAGKKEAGATAAVGGTAGLPTGIGLRWPGDHRGLAESKKENWGTRSKPHRRVGGGEAAGR